MEDIHNLINIGPTNTTQIFNQHEMFLNIFYVSFKWSFWQKWHFDVGTGAQQQRQEVY